jgi:hypothetical protein
VRETKKAENNKPRKVRQVFDFERKMDNRFGGLEIRWVHRSRSLKNGGGKLSEHENAE